MSEIKNPKVQEIKMNEPENFQNIKPSENMTKSEADAYVDKYRESGAESNEKLETGIPKEFYTMPEQREKCLPKDGEWTGKPGESKFIPNGAEVKEELAKFGLDGIEYYNGVPDFSKCAIVSAKIDNMTPDIGKNVNEFYGKLVEEGLFSSKRESKEFKQENGLAFHECSDMHTCQLIPDKIHEAFKHAGGRFECRLCGLSEETGGPKFDE